MNNPLLPAAADARRRPDLILVRFAGIFQEGSGGKRGMEDLQQLATGISDALKSIGNEFSSVWLLIQLGVMLLAGIIGILTAAVLRRRIDPASLTMGWPPFLRLLARKATPTRTAR
jgi:hypothetical protein